MALNKKRRIVWLVLSALVLLFLVALAWASDEEAAPARTITFWDIWALPRVWVGALLALAGTILLMTGKAKRGVRIASLIVIFFSFAVLSSLELGKFSDGMGLHPSPMCSIEKPFIFMQMGRAVPIVFIAIIAFVALISFLSNKSFCGWNCPIGAIQELLHRVPLPAAWKFKVPFRITNTIRLIGFVAFLAILFATGYSFYAYVNPFEFLHWTLEWAVIPAFVVTFIGALFVFRPFCYLLCPLGLLTWPIEQIALKKVRLDQKACTKCMRCVKASPCPAVPAILDEKRIRPDCHACGICIESCPENALRFK